jgi:hypothetical protein
VPRRKTWKLKAAEVKKKSEVKVAESWKNQCKDGDVWERYRDCVLAAADEVCGWTKGNCRHGETWWWDEGVRGALDDKRERFKEWKRDKTADAKYNKAKKRTVAS